MHHVAIMNKSWKLIPKILSGEKTIESRWYHTKRSPWNIVSQEDTVFFKDSGSNITASAKVARVIQYEHYSQKELKEIIKTYGGTGGICFANPAKAFAWTKDKKYAILVFLKNPKSIKPFPVNKKGFGNACAWLTINNIAAIKM
jgi:ASC-1-like (ASCH) protein